jgi:hypothetical protein
MANATHTPARKIDRRQIHNPVFNMQTPHIRRATPDAQHQTRNTRRATPDAQRQMHNVRLIKLIFANFMGRLDFLSRPFYGIC